MTSLTEHARQYSECLQRRATPLDEDGFRSPYERDAHRILYSDAFRRLRHKAQVFFIPNNDHICTRIEHVLHVAAASCTVAKNLGLDVDLTNAIALGHDLGHAPFGHHGEEVLSGIAKKHGINAESFQHEVHGLRVVDRLARLDREVRPGLNLTYAVRDGIISHCGEDSGMALVPADPTKKRLEDITNKKAASPPATYEGCVVKLVDRMVYAGRDIEDALQAELVLQGQIDAELEPVTKILGGNNGEIVNTLVSDLIRTSKGNTDGQISLSPSVADALEKLIRWNYDKIYNHPKVAHYKPQIELGITHIFDQLLDDLTESRRFTKPTTADAEVYRVFQQFVKDTKYPEEDRDEQIVLDFIAGMTDNYFIHCVSDLFVPRPIA